MNKSLSPAELNWIATAQRNMKNLLGGSSALNNWQDNHAVATNWWNNHSSQYENYVLAKLRGIYSEIKTKTGIDLSGAASGKINYQAMYAHRSQYIRAMQMFAKYYSNLLEQTITHLYTLHAPHYSAPPNLPTVSTATDLAQLQSSQHSFQSRFSDELKALEQMYPRLKKYILSHPTYSNTLLQEALKNIYSNDDSISGDLFATPDQYHANSSAYYNVLSQLENHFSENNLEQLIPNQIMHVTHVYHH